MKNPVVIFFLLSFCHYDREKKSLLAIVNISTTAKEGKEKQIVMFYYLYI